MILEKIQKEALQHFSGRLSTATTIEKIGKREKKSKQTTANGRS